MADVTIDYGHGLRVRVPSGTSVLEASLLEGIDHARACGGEARCTTCRVRIEEGIEHCPAPSVDEAAALAANGLEASIRLACQLRPTGDIRVRVLVEAHPAVEGEPCQATEEEVAVLFADIRGFTAFAEHRLPFDVLDVLNRYFDIVGVRVERHEGRIVGYLGDGIVAVFGAAGSDAPARRAVACALEMRQTLHRFGGYVRDHFDFDLRVGMAIHVGRAVVGEIGYFRDRRFNAVGDAVNVASRVEGLNKECETDILVSEPVALGCADLIETGRQFELGVRGREAGVRAFEVTGRRRPQD